MKATQLPVIVNDATTGHKLQGSSVCNPFIHCFSSVRNWGYVMLSRVRTRNGCFSERQSAKMLGPICHATCTAKNDG
jgi:hypothetical protein